MDRYTALSAVATTHGEPEPWRAAVAADFGLHGMRFYLGAARAGGAYRLVDQRAPAAHEVAPEVQPESAGIERPRAELRERLEFVSDPLPCVAQLAGLVSGELAFTSNQKEFDLSLTLFELTAAAQYLEFSSYRARASQGIDEAERALLAGRPRHLSFQSGRRIHRLLAQGSRIVVVLGARQPSNELDSVKLVGEPLRIRWHSDSFIEVPLDERQLTR